MATRKKKSEEELIAEISKLSAELTLGETEVKSKKKKAEWPKVTVGSHSTRTEYEDGRVDFVTDWEALQKDVREAIAAYEAENGKAKIKPPKKLEKTKKSQ